MPALIGALLAMLMTVVFVAPADATIIQGNRTQVDTSGFPYRAIVEITIPGTALDGTPLGRCTGWLYANNMVATAGHCVYDKRLVTNGWFDTKGMRVWPGINGSTTNAPYKSCGVKKSYAPTGWTSGQSEYYDYGAFRLDCTIGDTTGYLDFGAYPPALGQFTRVCGYPRDKALDTQWCSDGHVQATETYQAFYDNDTCVRNSGSPVMYWTPYGYWSVIAIHTTATHGTTANGSHFYYNHGTSITNAVSTDLRNWGLDTSAGTTPNPYAEPAKLPVSANCDR